MKASDDSFEAHFSDAAGCTKGILRDLALLNSVKVATMAAVIMEGNLEHLKPFEDRDTLRLEAVNKRGWHLKRYAILADGRAFAEDVAAAATEEALERLPEAGTLENAVGNHGIGFQIIHFAETAVVSPAFYWQWGSVLAQPFQIKAPWSDPTVFKNGVDEIVGCVWEMNIVRHEVEAWTSTILGQSSNPLDRVSDYLNACALSAR